MLTCSIVFYFLKSIRNWYPKNIKLGIRVTVALVFLVNVHTAGWTENTCIHGIFSFSTLQIFSKVTFF